VTVTLTDNGNDLESYNLFAVGDVAEYSGLLTVGLLDQTATSQGAFGFTDTGTTSTTAQSIELWVGAVAADSNTQNGARNGFTLSDGQNINYNGGLAYLQDIVCAKGGAESGTMLQSAADWSGCIATFRASSAVQPPTPSPTLQVAPTLPPTAAPSTSSPSSIFPSGYPLPTLQTLKPPPTSPGLKPTGNASGFVFGSLDQLITVIVVAVALALVVPALFMRRRRPGVRMRGASIPPAVSGGGAPPVGPSAEGPLAAEVAQETSPMPADIEEQSEQGEYLGEEQGEEVGEGVEGEFAAEEVEETNLQIDIGPNAFRFLKRRGQVFILTDLNNPQFTYTGVRGYDGNVSIEFTEFVEVCKTVPEEGPTEFKTSTFSVTAPMDTKHKDLGYYVAKSGFASVTDWLKSVKEETAIPECSAGRLVLYLYNIRARGRVSRPAPETSPPSS